MIFHALRLYFQQKYTNLARQRSNMQKETHAWFKSWFDTPYYHILYKDRDYTEAAQFMDKLTAYINLPEGAEILDLACGKGRHSIYLNSLGFDVTGIDLSENSIEEASKFSNEKLHFKVHNMCIPIGKQFDAVFNLFTSFGYFEDESDNLKTLKAIKVNLKETGFGVIDFLNVDNVLEKLVSDEIKTVEGIDFHIHRSHQHGYIIKEIAFEDGGEKYFFTEKVKALRLKDFELLFKEAEIDLIEIYGNYKLQKFETNHSPRLIILFK